VIAENKNTRFGIKTKDRIDAYLVRNNEKAMVLFYKTFSNRRGMEKIVRKIRARTNVDSIN